MKICYLILAHNNFKHLDRMLDVLNEDNNTFYIHIDKKVSEDYMPAQSNVKVILERLDINWGGFRMVEATLALMEYGITHSPNADYYILLSGVDYLIRSKEFLNELLQEGKEYIDIAPVPIPYKPIERYQHYFFDFKRRDAKLYNPLLLTEILLKKLKIKREAPFKIYAGTQWFALTHGCVGYILETIAKDSRYVNFFKYTLVPDEAFFQTIIGNSPFYKNAASSLTYTDWEVPAPPATIEDRHIDFLKTHIEFNDEYGRRYPYFARKFNDDSESVLKRIQDELW